MGSEREEITTGWEDGKKLKMVKKRNEGVSERNKRETRMANHVGLSLYSLVFVN